jgi:hypothetical protein
MSEQNKDDRLDFKECLLVGGGVGGAGLGLSAGFIGLAATVAAAPIAVAIGVAGGAAWWIVREIAKAINE